MKFNGATETRPGSKKRRKKKKFLGKLKFVRKDKLNDRIPLNLSMNNIYIVIII